MDAEKTALFEAADKQIGLGSAGGTWRTAPIQDLAQYSPQIALARAWGVPFAPYVLSCRATFVDQTNTLNPVSLENGQGRITQSSIVDRLVFEVDSQNAFSGNVMKSVSDFFFGLQSGIQATLDITGAPRYAVAPFFTPIRTLMSMVAEGWPMGWVLTATQGVTMQFQASIPLPTVPTTVTATFRMWQPIGTDEFVNMSNSTAFKELARVGCNVPDHIRTRICR